MPLSAGTILNNRYRIAALLGQGGFGAVYRVYDLNLERICALKENLDTSEGGQRQFKREAKMLADLSHPNLPRVTDYFILPQQGQYLVMDYIEGEDLEQISLRRREPLPPARVLDWVGQVCEALAYLHSQSPPIIHRDIKPANIKITPLGKAFLVDFGISKVYDQGQATTVGARAVTPGFSPQEQYGQGATDARTDIYALGATLYAALTGELPPESIQRNLGALLKPPHEINPVVTPQVSQAILQAMSMMPEGRFQRVEDFKAALFAPPVARLGLATVQVQHPVAATVQMQQPGAEIREFGISGAGMKGASTAGLASLSNTRPEKSIPWLWIGLGGVAIVLLVGLVAVGTAIFGGSDESNEAIVLEESVIVVNTATEVKKMPTTTSPPTATKTIRPTSTSRPSPTKTHTPALEPVNVLAYCDLYDKSYQITTGQPVVIFWGWASKTREQAQNHIDAVVYRIHLDGDLLRHYESDEIKLDSENNTYDVHWFVDAGVLSRGSHLIEYEATWQREITDGWAIYGPATGPIVSTCHFEVK